MVLQMTGAQRLRTGLSKALWVRFAIPDWDLHAHGWKCSGIASEHVCVVSTRRHPCSKTKHCSAGPVSFIH